MDPSLSAQDIQREYKQMVQAEPPIDGPDRKEGEINLL